TSYPSNEEIKKAVFFYLNASSASDLDDFGSSFYHACRDSVSIDVCNLVKQFFSQKLNFVSYECQCGFFYSYISKDRLY
ncbi:hypothetical protein VIGAN_02219900, partial [Vigna angularis var. angularis]